MLCAEEGVKIENPVTHVGTVRLLLQASCLSTNVAHYHQLWSADMRPGAVFIMLNLNIVHITVHIKLGKQKSRPCLLV